MLVSTPTIIDIIVGIQRSAFVVRNNLQFVIDGIDIIFA
jgi:hypothetical protein